MKINVKTLSGEDLEIDIDLGATVLDLKKCIELKAGISVEQQRLVYNGKLIESNGDLLKDQNLQNRSVVHMVIAYRGG
ncbi:ubiquitin [Vairimorpha necatrix]|uniref:Ubiquitin n=1 Tax=Vairimorpha necatrix TaxID=6039 RepID=A0AAX4J8Y6_9MICR